VNGGREQVPTTPGRWKVFFILLPLAAAALAADGRRPAAAAPAPKLDDICRTVTDETNFKVRVQAALVLGKLADPRAVPCLSRALGDPNKTVRAAAAQALGKLGDPSAADALRTAAKRDGDAFVRAQCEKALAMLTRAPPAVTAPGKLFLTFGPFTGGTKAATADFVKIVRDVLMAELGKLPTVTLTPPAPAAGGNDAGTPGFWIDGNVTRLEDLPAQGGTETSCGVRVTIARWPSKSMISWTNADASVQSGSRPRDKEIARRDCLEATAGQLAEDLAKFLKAQGG
jgi:hypothetical protein